MLSSRSLSRHRRFTTEQAHRRRWLWKRLETSVLIASAFVVGVLWGGLLVYAHYAQWQHGAWLGWLTPVAVAVAVGGSWAWTVEHSSGWEDAQGLPLIEARLALSETARQVLRAWERDGHALLVRDLRALRRA